MPEKRFTFICGDDDFLVTRRGQGLFAEMATGLTDDFSREVIDGAAGKVEEVEAAVGRVRAAVQTLSLFGDRKAVWLKGVNFLADSQTGRAEGSKKAVEELQELLGQVDPAAVSVLITAYPVDRRRKEYKWFQEHGNSEFLGGEGAADTVAALAASEAKVLKATFGSGALESLVGKVQGNTRLILEETRKLATYVGPEGGEITEAMVRDLVPNFGEGDFFEFSEAFFSLDLNWALDALRRHFFVNKEPRPLLSALQNRNRLLVQIRALVDAGEIRVGQRGIDKAGFDAAARTHGARFAGASEKSSFNLFTQNLWYLGNKVAPATRTLTLRRLIDFQLEFARAFEDLLERPQEPEAVMRDLTVRCLG